MEIFLNSMKKESCCYQVPTNKGSAAEIGLSTEVTEQKNLSIPTATIYWKNLR